ncbi:MAG: asparagine synthetase B family protein, partial [Flavipsychrobacter sp.]
MGAIVGFTGCDVQALLLMFDKLLHWQPDRAAQYLDENISLASLESYNTPESKYTPQPFAYQDIVIVADCRIDNRQELSKKMDLPLHHEAADIFFIAYAYKKWGKDCVKHLYGDFAFVIWDKSSQALFAARDHVGIKTLYYTIINGQFIFASEIKGILAYPGFRAEADDRYFVSSISGVHESSADSTPYTNIRMLSPGHFLEWHSGHLIVSRYWELGRNVPPVNNNELIPRFRELLFESVKCRLRSPQGIGAEVSGGLDSTSIAAIAMEILGKGTPFYSFCYGKPQNERFDILGDDTHIVKDFCNKYNVADYLHIVNEADYPWSVAEDLLLNVYDEDETTKVPLLTGAFLPAAKSAGVKVILSGHGGDHVASNLARGFYMQNAIDKNYSRLWRNLHSEFGPWRGIPRLAYYAVRGLNGTAIEREIAKKSLRIAQDNGLRSEVIQKYNLQANPGAVDLLSASNLQDKYIRNLRSNAAVKRAFYHDLVGTHFNVEYRFPLLDVRLIEFAMAIAPYVESKYGSQREFYRLVVKDLIPQQVWANRKSKVPTTPFIMAFYNRNNVLIKKRREAMPSGLVQFLDEDKLSHASAKLN